MKKLLIVLLLALAQPSAHAAYYDLSAAPYSLTQSDYKTKVSDRYATGKDTIALPYAWAALHGSGWGLTYSQFRGLYLFSAVFADAGWHGETKANAAKGYLNEFNFVVIPNGRFQSTISLTIPRAGFQGAGTFGYYLGTGAWTTECTMDDANWIDTDKRWHERVLFSTPQWNDETDYSYNESYNVRGIHLSGPGKNDGIIRIGIAFGRSGEASKWDMIKADNWSYGIVAKQGVPMSGGTCSVFANSIAGFAGIGCALASMRIDVISGDRNGALVALLPGYDAASGGSLDIGLAKAEDANPQGGGAFGSQIVGLFYGQFHVTIANVRFSCDARYNDAVFVVDPIIKGREDWGTQGSYLRASGSGFHYHTLLHNLASSTRRGITPDYTSWAFEWYAIGDKFASNAPGDWSAMPAGPTALASLARDPMTGAAIGKWDYAAGTPARLDMGGSAPPPVPVPVPVPTPVPVPVPSTVIASFAFGDGATANIPATTGAALVQPVGWQQYTSIAKGVLSNSNSNASYPVAWKGVTHLTIKGLTWSGTPGYQSLLGNAMGGLKVYPDGSVVDSRSSKTVAPKGTVANGKAVDLDVSIDMMDVSYFGAAPGTGSCWKGTMTGLTVK